MKGDRKMNRSIRIILSFVLPFFCLLISVSYATWTEVPNSATASTTSVDTSDTIAGYTLNSIRNYFTSTDIEGRNTMLNAVSDAGYYVLWFSTRLDNSVYYTFIYEKDSNIDIGANVSSSDRFHIYPYINEGDVFYFRLSGTTTNPQKRTCTKSGRFTHFTSNGYTLDAFNKNISADPNYFGNIPYIKTLLTNSGYYWDGNYYKSPTDEPDTPTLPTNAEIAQAVQAFYDSDYYKNNKDFSDFMLLYNTTNGNCSFVGHTLGNILGQVIIPPNYRYQGRLYNEQWWKFYIDENQGALPYSSTYHLYSSNISEPNIISDEGIGKISELVNLDFSTKSTIVYSTTDYPVRTYVLDETTGDYTYTDGTIEGDQYTYDENLDPTISGYNPLDNFVTVDPAQTIVGNADFDGLSNSFENHKDLFSFTENMQWLIVANNKLSNYFLGFIIMCALFITLGRVLKG